MIIRGMRACAVIVLVMSGLVVGARCQKAALQNHLVAEDKIPGGPLYVLDTQGAIRPLVLLSTRGKGLSVTPESQTPLPYLSKEVTPADVVIASVDWKKSKIFLTSNTSRGGTISICEPQPAPTECTQSWILPGRVVTGIDYDPLSATLFVAANGSNASSIFKIMIKVKGAQPEFVANVIGCRQVGAIFFDAARNTLLAVDMLGGSIYKVSLRGQVGLHSELLVTGFVSPRALLIDRARGIVYVADAGAKNVSTFLLQNPQGTVKVLAALSDFKSPSGLAMLDDESIAVLDSGSDAIYFVSRDGVQAGPPYQLRH